MILGFTGTREKLPNAQIDKLKSILIALHESVIEDEFCKGITEFHHGDCLGADFLADAMVRTLIRKKGDIRIVVHPPSEVYYRAFCSGDGTVIRTPRTYRTRNKSIVDCCDMLIACSKTSREEKRSGTWMTVRMARKDNKPILIIFPNGTVRKEEKTVEE